MVKKSSGLVLPWPWLDLTFRSTCCTLFSAVLYNTGWWLGLNNSYRFNWALHWKALLSKLGSVLALVPQWVTVHGVCWAKGNYSTAQHMKYAVCVWSSFIRVFGTSTYRLPTVAKITHKGWLIIHCHHVYFLKYSRSMTTFPSWDITVEILLFSCLNTVNYYN